MTEIVEFTPFADLNAVPQEIAVHQGARLSLDQVNTLIARAYALSEIENSPDLGAAWSEFRESHYVENTIWVEGNGNNA
jgi:hypothetical protein